MEISLEHFTIPFSVGLLNRNPTSAGAVKRLFSPARAKTCPAD